MGSISFLSRLTNVLILFPLLSLLLPLYELLVLLVLACRSFIFPAHNLKGKVVLITGAASGIGEQIAYEYARRGARLALIDINGDALQEVSDEARRRGSPDVMWDKADVSIPHHSYRFIKQTIQRFARLDHLVNNAGILKPFGLFQNVSDTCTLRPIMDINFWGSVYTTHNAIPYLRQTKGKIIAVASSLGHVSAPNSIIYNASKAAVISLYETLRVEMGSEIGITIVTPSAINTPLIRGIIEVSTISIGRMCKADSGRRLPWRHLRESAALDNRRAASKSYVPGVGLSDYPLSFLGQESYGQCHQQKLVTRGKGVVPLP